MASHRKTHLFGAAQPRAQFVQLEVRELQSVKGALVQRLSVRALARQPGGDSRLPVAENPFRTGRVQPLRPVPSAPLRSAEMVFSAGTTGCGVEH